MPQTGQVFLVGAGPGDPGLITLRGLQCLALADLVLYDGLVNPLLLRHSAATAERTCRVETATGRSLPQAEINQRLIAAAREGKTVVRLKGGDPFVFGRGSEEAAALAAAGIPFEVVPGVTAAIAASAYAGISLTHRNLASAVAFITGHEDPDKSGSVIDYPALAAFPGTLVFYMGLHRLSAICQALISAGRSPETPAAVISRGTTPGQRTIVANLQTLPDRVAEGGLHAPSLIVVGDCVSQRDQINWFEHRPLFGQRIGITRPAAQADPIVSRVVELGGQPILMPTIEIAPPATWDAVDAAIDHLCEVDWLIFTSANGVRALLDRLWQTHRDLRSLGGIRLAAIGDSTAAALEQFHLRPDLVPPEFRAEALATALVPHVRGKRVLWARASRGRNVLPAELRNAGAHVDEVIVYQNTDAPQLPPDAALLLDNGHLDWIGISSPAIARNLYRLLSPQAAAAIGQQTKLASISPVTTSALQELGWPVAVEASTYTWDGILEAIMESTGG